MNRKKRTLIVSIDSMVALNVSLLTWVLITNSQWVILGIIGPLILALLATYHVVRKKYSTQKG